MSGYRDTAEAVGDPTADAAREWRRWAPGPLVLLLLGMTPGAAWPGPNSEGGAILGDASRPTVGAADMREPHSGSLLIEYYRTFLRDRDLDGFRDRVAARYAEPTLCRILVSCPWPNARRGAVLALGVLGTYDGCNSLLGKAMRDPDPVVRVMAERALWIIWFRADTPENNQALEEVRLLAANEELDEAIERASRLIDRAPRFAEAYNQRAIAYFKLGRYAESAEDCRRTLNLNPYHVGALGGLSQCQLELDQPREALKTLRRALRLQPFSQPLGEAIRTIEARLESDGPR